MSIPNLVPFLYGNFPLGSIAPRGWMKQELELCGNGLGGHLFLFYRFVKDSTWLGGQYEYSALNEAAPYWYNYIVPLAYGLDKTSPQLSAVLRKQADEFLDHVLHTQADDGWLGPEKTRQTRGIWARCLLLQGMINHALAVPERYESVINSLVRFVHLVHRMLSDEYTGYLPAPGDLFDPQWFGVVRAHELSLNLQWLFENVKGEDDKRLIWEAMEMMWKGARKAGRDWTTFLTNESFPRLPSVKGSSLNFQHGVNLAQGLRYPAQLFRMHPSATLRQQCYDGVELAFKYHGVPAGALSSDEYIGGTSSQRGVELCCTVELMFSLAYLHQLLGDAELADRVELAAFNSFPAAISPDWWSHQYVTQTNQPGAQELQYKPGEKSPFYDVCAYANVFGLEPEFPCCTVNHPTAYSKLLMHAFRPIQSSNELPLDAGVLHSYLIAGELSFPGLHIRCDTTYPFHPLVLNYTIQSESDLAFYIRVPGWATEKSSIRIEVVDHDSNIAEAMFVPNLPNTQHEKLKLHKVHIPAQKEVQAHVALKAETKIHEFSDQTVSICHGPLLYAYEVESQWTTRMPRNYKDQRSDCVEVISSPSDNMRWMQHVRDHDGIPKDKYWGLAIDTSMPVKLVENGSPILPRSDESAWTSRTSPTYVEATMQRVDWPIVSGTAADAKDVDVSKGRQGEKFVAKLVPFGCAKLHMAQFPKID